MTPDPSLEPGRTGMAMNRTATCACGAISITVRGEPQTHGVCHCANCMRRTGSAFGISAYFPRASIVSQSGRTAVYAFHHATQNHEQARHFCTHCGTTLFWFISTLPQSIGIAGGCFGPGGLPEPTYSVTHACKEPWVQLPANWHLQQG